MNRHRRWFLTAAASGILGAAICTTGCGSGQDGLQAAAPQPVPATARFQAIIYQTLLPPERVGELDAKALAAGDPEDLTKALAAFGTTKTLYQVDLAIELADGKITVGSRVPVVVASRMTETGQKINAIQYEKVGATFRIKGTPGSQGQIDLRMEVDLSSVSESAVEVARGFSPVTLHEVRLTHIGPVTPGIPFVDLSVDSSTRDKDGNAVAFVCRSVITP